MPYSFWIFLAVCFISFIPVINDHGESWRTFKEATNGKKLWPGVKYITLWMLPILTFVGTLFLGYESLQDDKENKGRDHQINSLSNSVSTVEAEYKGATDALAKASARLKDVKTPKEQFFRLLDSISGDIVPSLTEAWKNGYFQETFSEFASEGDIDKLKEFAKDPTLSKYFTFTLSHMVGFPMASSGLPGAGEQITLDINPAITQLK